MYTLVKDKSGWSVYKQTANNQFSRISDYYKLEKDAYKYQMLLELSEQMIRDGFTQADADSFVNISLNRSYEEVKKVYGLRKTILTRD